ncbi:MAG TPA: hypothetical protein ENN44_05825 [Methanoculleus sp.]|nr:hypothetical protein [Methanoculleus sp.]
MGEPCTIHLNNRHINSVEVPKITRVAAGENLYIKFINHGAPTHLTLRALNGNNYTDFFHANIYVPDFQKIKIPIKEFAPEGSFVIQVIVGYGMHAEDCTIDVIRPSAPEEFSASPDLPDLDRPDRDRTVPVMQLLPLVLTMALSLFLYALWLSTETAIYNYVAYVLMILGVTAAWSSRR